MKNLRFKRRQFRVGLIALGIFATVVIAFNFWFIDHSETTLEEIVAGQSNGKMKLKVGKFKFNWLTNKIQLRDAFFYTTDSSAPTLTTLATENIEIKARGFLPLLFKKQVLIDSIHIYAPKVLVTKINENIKKLPVKDTAAIDDDEERFSLAKELGKVSNSISEAIDALKINRFVLDDGTFSLIDKTEKNDKPLVIDKIRIRLDNLQVDATTEKRSRKKIAFTDDIAVQTSDQNIAFPGGKHFLSFKNFKVSLSDQRVVFDSCTIRGIKGDSSKTAFRIFFDELQMTKINFDTLYTAEVIQADSVFCINPDIFFDVDGDQVIAKRDRKKIQNVDELVQQLLGDVMLNYVIVQNADININTIKHGNTNTFTSTNNNFELQGLVVRQNYERPVRVKRLFMNLQDYETVLQDGRYAIAFDSVRFEDNTITLNDFSFREYAKGGLVKNLKMPRFELRGLSWESLLYENTFNASSARFDDPTILLTIDPGKTRKPKSIFETLADLGEIMNLTDLGINHGDITLNLGKGARLELMNTDLSLYADELTASKKIKNIQHSLKHLNVDRAIFSKGSLTASLNNVSLIENNNGIRASAILLRDAGLNAEAKGVRLNSIILDSLEQVISINGLTWNSGAVSIYYRPGKQGEGTAAGANNLALNNIKGGPTTFKLDQGDRKISAFLTGISVNEILKPIGGAVQINGLQVTGRDALMTAPDQRLSIRSLSVTDNDNSVVSDINFSKINTQDSIVVNIPQLTIIPNVTQIVAGNLFLKNLVLTDPVIHAKFGRKDSVAHTAKKPAPQISLGAALLQRPQILLSFTDKDNLPGYITWNGVKENSFMRLTDVMSDDKTPLAAKQVDIYLTNFNYVNKKGKRIATDDNKLNLRFEDLLVQKDGDEMIWKTNASVLSLDKLYFDSLGEKNATVALDKGDVKNIKLDSRFSKNAMDILKNSENLTMTGTNGSFTSVNNTLDWYNLSFNKGYFHVDSFYLRPLQSVEDYKVKKAFDQDYLMIRSGVATGGPFDLVKYAGDSILSVGGVELNDVKLITFKDKRQEDTAQKEKPLFTTLIKNIPGKLDMDSLRLKNMYVEYWEINPKTDTLGIVPVFDMNVVMRNIKNHNIGENDSLYIFASANVIHDLFTKLEVRQSYLDSLGTYLMKLETGPMDLTRFNEILLPLEGIEVLSGHLDSLRLEAVANNNYSTGQMRMYYDGLKLRLMNKKDFERQGLGNKLLSWAANTFVIRKNNQGRESLVFFERWKDKSAINFLIKTTLSGIKSSVGLPGIKGKQRRYFNKQREK